MASFPMPNPQASAPQGGGQSASPQANPLQDILGQIAKTLLQLGQQNTVIQEDLRNAVQSLVQAIQKTQAASGSAPQQSAAPQQQ